MMIIKDSSAKNYGQNLKRKKNGQQQRPDQAWSTLKKDLIYFVKPEKTLV